MSFFSFFRSKSSLSSKKSKVNCIIDKSNIKKVESSRSMASIPSMSSLTGGDKSPNKRRSTRGLSLSSRDGRQSMSSPVDAVTVIQLAQESIQRSNSRRQMIMEKRLDSCRGRFEARSHSDVLEGEEMGELFNMENPLATKR